MATDPLDSYDMIDVYMPNRDLMVGEYAPYQFLKETEDTYKSARDNFRKLFDSCGKGSKTDPPTAATVSQVTDVPSGDTGLFNNYAATVSKLKTTWQELQAYDVSAYKTIRDSSVISTNCQIAFNSAISELNDSAGSPPPDGQSEDEHIWSFLTDSITKTTSLVKDAAGKHDSNSDPLNQSASELDKLNQKIDADDKKIAADDKKLSDDEAEISDLKSKLAAAGSGSPGLGVSYGPGASVGTGYSFGNGYSFGTSTAYSYGSGVSTGSSYGAGTSSSGTGNGNGNGSSYGAGTGTGSTGTNTGGSTGGGGTDLMSMLGQMLPMLMMSQMMNPNKDLNNPSNSQNRQETTPPPAASQAQPQNQAQPGTGQSSTAPTGASSSQPTAPPQGRTPASDGSVLYTFDDGRTQKVSAVVAQALDAARAKKDGTDAQDAYSKTAAKWKDNKQIGDAVDPSQLMTGDVATWANHTAIVVVFPPGQNGGAGSLEVIAEGKLQPFAPQMSDKSGDFGDFAGFQHPHGIEMTGSSDPTAATGGVVPAGDPSSAAAPAAAAPVPS